jgi:hypothetical protein
VSNAGTLLLLLLLALSGCSKPTLRVADIQLGRSLNADNSVREHTTAFTPKDSIYVSVLTAGRGSATLSVRWSLGSRVLDEAKKPVSYTDAAATDFGLKSGWGFPKGEYTADVFMDGQLVGSRKFKVDDKR